MPLAGFTEKGPLLNDDCAGWESNAVHNRATLCGVWDIRPTDNDVIELIIHGYCRVYAPCSVPCGIRDDRACRLVSCLRSDADAENIGWISVIR